MKRFSKYKILLLLIILLGAFLRFYNLDWGDQNFFHPDERNIAIATSNINFIRGDYNPDFFAYGSFPIYMIYIVSKGDFETSLLFGRLLSAIFSTISLYLIYLITKNLLFSILLKDGESIKKTNKIETYSLLAVALAAFSPGLIQFAHFTTFESFLTFEYLLFTFLALKLLNKPSFLNYVFIAVIMGLSVGTKIVSLFLVGVFLVIHFFVILKGRTNDTNKLKFIIKFPFKFLNNKFFSAVLLSILIFVLTNPFIFLDYQNFRNSLNYESSVARGTLPVFYTQQFLETIPFVYQVLYVFPSLISWPLTIFSLFALFYLIIYCLRYGLRYIFKNESKTKLPIIVFTLIGLGYTAFHLTMYVKWSRYMVPSIPFLIIAFVIVLVNLSYKRHKMIRLISKSTLFVVSIFAIIQGLTFFTIYLKPDPRLEAATWLKDDAENSDTFAGEVYDIGMTAFNGAVGNHRITEYDYYNLDDGINDQAELESLNKLMDESEYVIVPAERIYPTRVRLKDEFPNGYRHYEQLFEGELGFVKVAEFTRTTYLEDLFDISFYSGGIFMPLNYDETFRVFDQPTVTIFKKNT
ncbi:MAG TPA: hypothetical protein PLS50_03235 [Candidatus Dojkabacteria bacterium]|nr:hypothetical protein [Candidatus Dojkabacteria bacterium]